ncbi:hypothetical protein D9M71_464430 [compost metagenome]
MPVVRLENLDIHVITQHAGGGIQQLQAQVDADTEVGGEDDRYFLAGLDQLLFLFWREASSADDHGLACLAAERQILQGHRRVGEVDQHVELVDHLAQVVGNRHTDTAQGRQLTGIGAHQRAVRAVDRRRQARLGRLLLHGLDEGLAHPPCRAHHCNTSHSHFLVRDRRRSASRHRTSHWPWASESCHLPASHAALRAAHAGGG